MANLKELQRQHRVFAEETFAYLLDKSDFESQCLTEKKYFRSYIGKAIVTISYIFRKDYGKIFSRISGNLKHVKMFKNYCLTIPVKKDKRYFYYVLMRVSLIFELSLYCYNKGYHYFKTAEKCVAKYENLQYFESLGGWNKLKHTALFIASLGRPLALIMAPSYDDQGKEIQTFEEAFNALDNYFITTGNLEELDSAEMHFLSEISKVNEIEPKKGKTKCLQNEEPEKENEFSKYLKTLIEDSFAQEKDPYCILITEYSKKCLNDLVSSRALGYSEDENTSNECSLNENEVWEEMTDVSKPCELPNSVCTWNVDFSDKKVVYIDKYKSSCIPASTEKSGQPLDTGKPSDMATFKYGLDMIINQEISLLGLFHSDSRAHCSKTVSDISGINPLSSNRRGAFGEPADLAPMEIYPENNRNESHLSETIAATSEDLHQKTDENLDPGKECSTHPTFIVPKVYLRLNNSDDASNIHLYAIKICPPSTRRVLSEPLKKLLDENIESQNYHTMPSGDLLVCPPVSSVNSDTLIILVESFIDEDEFNEDTDILICLFKKMEIDSLGNKLGYSLRPRQPNALEKSSSSEDLDRAEAMTGELPSSDEEPNLKISRIRKGKQGRSIENVKLYAKDLLSHYKKHFPSILDEYFNKDFSAFSTKQYRKTSKSNKDNCKYVFAVSASIMARRKVLLDEPEENKRVIGIQLYKIPFQPKILPLNVQRELDLQIKERSYFAESNGVYGVGPKRSTAKKNIWVIFYSGNGSSKSVEYEKEDSKEIPKIFRSYETVLETFIPFSKDTIKSDLDIFENVLNDIVNDGFEVA